LITFKEKSMKIYQILWQDGRNQILIKRNLQPGYLLLDPLHSKELVTTSDLLSLTNIHLLATVVSLSPIDRSPEVNTFPSKSLKFFNSLE
jgi:hypothetical protein